MISYQYSIDAATLQNWAPGTLHAYQKLDSAYEPMPGIENTVVGYLLDEVYDLPAMVETDYYELRLSFLNYDKLCTDGLTIQLAQDAPQQPHLIELTLCDQATCSLDTPGGVAAVDSQTGKIDDYTKATVLVHRTTNGTQTAGSYSYLIALSPPKDSNMATWLKGTKGTYAVDGKTIDPTTETTINLPILLQVKITVDNRDAIELLGTDLPPIVLNQPYQATLTAQKGQPPYAWSVEESNFPDGLTWSSNGSTYCLSGTVAEGTDGAAYSCTVKVASNKSVVMKATRQPISIALSPSDAQKSNFDWNKLASIASFAPIILLIGAVVWVRKRWSQVTDEDVTTITQRLTARMILLELIPLPSILLCLRKTNSTVE
ncbi:hypothetical protein [Leptolyngbya sp. 7M]|uniref:hypothetical protein n=1 Tax=Leptolyngbya sp. 7M TaxID=2812896 RepID=UPI001B8C653C|nr:hypothetical protein [Leptolyngbya sp. 7M]QYO65095.1 hypothetical protein JVX88_37265 [Leptolyngbya sp. 7M]